MLKGLKTIVSCVSLGAACLLAAGAADAHHSFAMFDEENAIEITGNVAKVNWTNPHMVFWVAVPDQKGGAAVWTIESPYGPGGLKRYGWDRNTLTVGDKVQMWLSPLRNGKPGGSLESITFMTGKNAGKTMYNGSRGKHGGLTPPPGGNAPAGGPPAGSPPPAGN